MGNRGSTSVKGCLAPLRLAVFDLDGTLTTVRSPFLFVSKKLGLENSAKELEKSYWRGEIGYRSWGSGIVRLWQGIAVGEIKSISSGIPYRQGCREFIEGLRFAGVEVALVSVAFAEHVMPRASELGIDHVLCNQLHVKQSILTGGFTYSIDGENKCDAVRSLQRKLGIGTEETLVAGDTEGDIPMFELGAMSIAVAPESQAVVTAASARLPNDDWSRAWELIETRWCLQLST